MVIAAVGAAVYAFAPSIAILVVGRALIGCGTGGLQSGLKASFTNAIVQDHAAVKAALTEPRSNGQTEGHNTKLKLVKRQMYGRAGLDLLKARLLAAT
jgi:hypothetical protein